jgi:hypothetical protein
VFNRRENIIPYHKHIALNSFSINPELEGRLDLSSASKSLKHNSNYLLFIHFFFYLANSYFQYQRTYHDTENYRSVWRQTCYDITDKTITSVLNVLTFIPVIILHLQKLSKHTLAFQLDNEIRTIFYTPE